jgi:hypothetical protein
MVTPKLTDEQVIDLVKQLPPESKQAVLSALGSESDLWRQITLGNGEDQLRRLCAEHGLDWDKMSEEERENFIDRPLHEDRGSIFFGIGQN